MALHNLTREEWYDAYALQLGSIASEYVYGAWRFRFITKYTELPLFTFQEQSTGFGSMYQKTRRAQQCSQAAMPCCIDSFGSPVSPASSVRQTYLDWDPMRSSYSLSVSSLSSLLAVRCDQRQSPAKYDDGPRNEECVIGEREKSVGLATRNAAHRTLFKHTETTRH
ncbi:uncharacterized protein LAESUDRAFT_713635 [Laetiporus sulphureus 93-53]|uniref:Uncharacterized protein n=1 Tax=Laetiporus sulphureus 93-53 TaxID=1314785 RepID=A0A165EQK3_9APHY|nr:uncharacterized protein LAESUDRAFT_713635 [Laetiporus sulphureus 93-53]KZT07557.1 hypothetical protein LAESUDRAFT_713635 [Laetiporus sulphureus 93-53]